MRQWLLNQVDDFLKSMEDNNHMAKMNARFIEAMTAQQDLNNTLKRLGLYDRKKVINEEALTHDEQASIWLDE